MWYFLGFLVGTLKALLNCVFSTCSTSAALLLLYHIRKWQQQCHGCRQGAGASAWQYFLLHTLDSVIETQDLLTNQSNLWNAEVVTTLFLFCLDTWLFKAVLQMKEGKQQYKKCLPWNESTPTPAINTYTIIFPLVRPPSSKMWADPLTSCKPTRKPCVPCRSFSNTCIS